MKMFVCGFLAIWATVVAVWGVTPVQAGSLAEITFYVQ